MSTSLLKQSVRSDFNFFALTALTWLCYFFPTQNSCNASVVDLVVFALGAGVVSYLTLKAVGYFDALRLLPRKSDPALVLCAIPFGGVAQHQISQSLFGIDVCSVSTILLWTPLLSMIIFGTHYLVSWMLLRYGLRKKVVLDLSMEERAEIVEDFEGLGVASYVDFLTRQHLKEHLLAGRGSDIDLIVISRNSTTQFDAEALLIRGSS
jgi:hypothetical protein